ncbi:MAG TPA: hypothetical protein VL947_05345, partial [Cytophagales bacterium]|nr:hypothetical protein [Cytophagales bacterium]
MRSIAILATLFFGLNLLAQNLIVNPGAEETTLSGWTKMSPNWVSGDQIQGHNGSSRHFFADDVTFFNPRAEIYQDVDVSAYAADIDAGKA